MYHLGFHVKEPEDHRRITGKRILGFYQSNSPHSEHSEGMEKDRML